METCGSIQCPRFAGSFDPDRPECLREAGHNGEHLGKESTGVYVIYWRDLSCSCEGCKSSEPFDWCEPFRHINVSQARELLASPEATLLDWTTDVVRLKE